MVHQVGKPGGADTSLQPPWLDASGMTLLLAESLKRQPLLPLGQNARFCSLSAPEERVEKLLTQSNELQGLV